MTNKINSPPVFTAGHSPFERGMALVLTLIMLAVTLVMVVAFLAISRRERNAVSTTTDTTIARLAADSALAAAQAQIVGNVLSSGAAAYNYRLLVSTNYIDPAGYNVLTIGKVLPRPPVFISTNIGYDFRFYLDLNRNGKFDSNGVVAEVDSTGAATGNTVFVIGDPEWIGVLERPDVNHANNNKFISRFAFLAQPIGNSLDLNHIHNQTRSRQVTNANDGYFHNQGVGSWELNLAGFLEDLNTNIWSSFYTYNQPFSGNSGFAFQDALSLLAYRYAYNYNSLYPANRYFANTANYPFNFDGYSDGLLQNTVNFDASSSPDILTLPWAGADNTNRFFALLSDFFDSTKNLGSFPTNLIKAGSGASTYDSYTFYRLLDQLGTDSTATSGKLNLNYRNVTNGVVVAGMETNFYAWTALEFFTNAADRMLKYYTTNWLVASYVQYTNTFGDAVTNTFGVTRIPVYVNGRFVYTPAVNRILQLAANIYDATATNSQFPSVFRPMFSRVGSNVFITNYKYVPSVSNVSDLAFSQPFDAATIAVSGGTNALINVYGVPWIIGAKKGLPNFNQFSVLNQVQVTRKLQVTKPSLTAAYSQFHTNQMYLFSITNLLGCSFWNSYASTNTGNFKIIARDYGSLLLTNDASYQTNWYFTNNWYFATNSWPGTLWQADPTTPLLDIHNHSFVTFNFTNPLLTNAIYRYAGYRDLNGVIHSAPYFDPSMMGYQTNVYTPPLPHFGLLTTNRLQVFILDGTHVIDYAHFAGPDSFLDFNTNKALPDPDSATTGTPAWMWSTNGYQGGTTPWGVVNQINVSLATDQNPATGLPPGEAWNQPQNLPAGLPDPTKEGEQLYFGGFFDNVPRHPGVYIDKGKQYTNRLLTIQVPYTPTTIITNSFSWQANDPLVHYLASDLDFANGPVIDHLRSAATLNFTLSLALTNLSLPFAPWGKDYYLFASAQNNGKYEHAQWLMPIKDPLVWRSDDWDFPTNKLATPGWLGRVHRGTPWQTIYLKAANIVAGGDLGLNTWKRWAGNTNDFDAANSAPVQDSALFDIFSTTLHPNATFGTLSINQANFAAWSAVFSGMITMTNSGPASYLPMPIVASTVVEPAGAGGTNSALGRLISGILSRHNSFTNEDGLIGAFEHLGDILRVPELTEESPFLNLTTDEQKHFTISDQLYEWLPQQAMGLLRVSSMPRYVIYCYGQTLRPAANSIMTSGSIGLITNYQVMAESAARAVVRVDKNVVTNAVGAPTGTNYSTVIESYDQLPPQ